MTLDIRNPAQPETIVARHPETSPSEIDTLVDRARTAQRLWREVPQPERGKALRRYLHALEARADELVQSITQEMGKIHAESRGEVMKSIAEGHAVVDRAGAPIGEVFPSEGRGVTAYTIRRPRGVVLGITPWNFPFGTPVRKLIPCLLYGNAMILKPASIAPGAVRLMAEIAEGILPDDLLGLAIGNGALGQTLCEHDGINAVTFTGSVATGKRVAVAAAGHLAEVSLELGGKNPVIINDATDLDAVLDQIFRAAFAICGQRCTAISRVIVQQELVSEVVAGLARRADALRLGDGAERDTQFGPLSSAGHLSEVDGFVSRARNEGAAVAAGGAPVEMPGGGFFYPATILADVTPQMEVARDEVFGPVLSVLTYKTIDEALEIANATAYGLTSSLYSERTPVIDAFLDRSESGMLHVNAGTFPENHLPFVGVKDSGLGVGGSNGPSVIQFYTSEHTIYRKAQA
ncbi:aldehyde dehydrogenase family protein [Palleronia caenipelagi]|uniref:Aldehyde dehydrogenase n=1 Tax=Palleronia caenipelagi TaxID=2489174 RepID=A0A547PMH4_9RHOB|nr:aldehyde dehydrogenase family protein [Palleronia caenipelagi]TRD15352.1 aldehyde dehydrogenase [Palleronia caenipelagi]